jgi:hypothetical protein
MDQLITTKLKRKKQTKKILSCLKIWFAIWFLIIAIAYNTSFGDSFYLSKNITEPGEVISINGACSSGAVFVLDQTNIGIIEGNNINIFWVWETNVREITFNCDNTGAILLTSTSDWKEPFMSLADFNTFTLYEICGVWFVLFIIWLFYFIKK